MTALRIKRQYAGSYPASQASGLGKTEPFGDSPFRLTLPCVLTKLLMTIAPLSCLVQLQTYYISISHFVKCFFRRRFKAVPVRILRAPGIQTTEQTIMLRRRKIGKGFAMHPREAAVLRLSRRPR